MFKNRLTPFLRRSLTTTLAVGLASAPLQATWSIAVINVATGEVVVAGATCIPDINVIGPIASVAVGLGGGASQAAVWPGAKVRIFNGLREGRTPEEIMTEILNDAPNPAIHQFGVVGLLGPPQTYTGANDGAAALGAAGSVGDLRYAIQGNVLAGDSVVDMAVEALANSEGDLGQRVMSAMQAAAAQGGDGRCSCSAGAPTSCGTPPPGQTHSAYTSFIVIARHGDTDSATCGMGSAACANGDYYARLTNLGNQSDPDPIRRLTRQYEQWRVEQLGRADQYLTEVYSSAQLVQADGLDGTTIDIALVDVDGNPVTAGGQTILATAVEDPGVTISSVTDNGDGTFRLTVVGGMTPGPARIRLVVQDGIRDVQLYPDVELEVLAPTELFANQASLSAGEDEQVQFDLFDASSPGGNYLILGSASGTSPGTPWGTLTVPLNEDRLFHFMVLQAGGAALPNTIGSLDGAGRATAWANFRTGQLQQYAGGHFDFVAFRPGSPDRVTNLVGMDITP
jgi:uncharacterized Ntn-hydrolase superfamily protein